MALDVADMCSTMALSVHCGQAAALAANEELIQSLAGVSAEKWDLDKG